MTVVYSDVSVERLTLLLPNDMSQVRTSARIPHIVKMFVVLLSYFVRILRQYHKRDRSNLRPRLPTSPCKTVLLIDAIN
jgi:hypothetical protein